MLRTILIVLQVLSGLIIVGLVLLQRGKGADAGAGFGAGASGTVFGARGASTGLSRMTAIFAAIFMLNSLFLTYLFQSTAPVTEESLLDRVQQEGAAAPATVPPPVDADAVPQVAPAQQPEQAQPEQAPANPQN